jgi:cell division protein FtsN
MAKATTAAADVAPSSAPASAAATPSGAQPAPQGAQATPPTISRPITDAAKRHASDSTVASATAAAGYEVQLGAFGTMANAEKVRESVAADFPGARIDSITSKGKTLFRVRVGPFATGSEAADAEARLRTRGFSPVRFNAPAKNAG